MYPYFQKKINRNGKEKNWMHNTISLDQIESKGISTRTRTKLENTWILKRWCTYGPCTTREVIFSVADLTQVEIRAKHRMRFKEADTKEFRGRKALAWSLIQTNTKLSPSDTQRTQQIFLVPAPFRPSHKRTDRDKSWMHLAQVTPKKPPHGQCERLPSPRY